MMSTFKKFTPALLALFTLSLSGSLQAAQDTTEVLVTATVPSWVKVDTADSVDLGNESNKETSHPIRISSNNTNQVTQITVKQKGTTEDHMMLSHTDKNKTDRMKVKVDIKESEVKEGEFSSGQIVSKKLAATQAGAKMTLLLTPVSDFSKLETGSYQGTLSITALVN
ncbi:hypothetical protein AAGR22_05350 [Erwinia sp. HDF1-3R]|uniref:hypothetical protein n=1 Tax=Erwinia sp. HDF1-3R TaxID=3141543 RepID=UPI0031F4FCE8